MKLGVRTTSMTVGALAAAGVSTLFLGAAPATAATEACGATGTLVGPGICEQTFDTSGSFVATAQMTRLEVLLVGAGGMGATQQQPNGGGTQGYAAAGGGGQVTIVDLHGSVGTLGVNVAQPSTAVDPGTDGSVTGGVAPATVDTGNDGIAGDGGEAQTSGTTSYGVGGSASNETDPATTVDGGAGIAVSAVAPAGSLFSTDNDCYSGGGAAGVATPTPNVGAAGCGGGTVNTAGTAFTSALANSGGGGAGIDVNTNDPEAGIGATGKVVFRWNAANVSLSFNTSGHGTAPATESVVAGAAPAKPADPVAAGYTFAGWFTDPGLTTAANFSAPLTASATFYAKFTPQLAETGVTVSSAEVAIPVGIVVLGGALLTVAAVRRRRRGRA